MEYEFTTAADIKKLCSKHKIKISELAKRYESERAGVSHVVVRNRMKKTRDVIWEAIENGIGNKKKSDLKMSGGDAAKMYAQLTNMRDMMSNRVCVRAMAYALAIGEQNALMGRIAAFPTAGGAGVVPGVLFSSSQHFHAGKRRLLRAMFCASAVGIVIASGATISAAKGGCQAEVGAAAAMAAAGLIEMQNGTVEQCFDAAAITLKSYLGLVCDPLGGLVEVPCIKRNSIAAMAAIGAGDMVMAGIKSFVPFDEVVRAMKNIAETMSPKLRETALGGLAATPTGNKIKKKLGLPIIK
ncbi:L-serine ammonia-lyase, iron-sulfur-dependent, subunit alpha [Candidatus Peregrinibacteria bacterium]|nr:L-serine ammonia-lyase, iron-sulfur-dependent, subunit alpha [Candidatus Peregrinibacteria bacterium]